ncbi:MAG: hypothetical protein PHO63_06475 [Bacilli bacterium]|nr:hypothetical protein [Bacilli bacterium]
MKNSITVYDENNNAIVVDVVANFRIEEYNKDYVVYTLNDDLTSEMVNMCISQVDLTGDTPKFISIPDEEVNTVLSFYDYVRDHVTGEREEEQEV